MTNQKSHGERGQALLVSAVLMIAVLGMLGMVLDIGWAYFVSKKAQTAADAAALGAAAHALILNGPAATPDCGTLACQSALSCPAVGDLLTACEYAQANGFVPNGEGSTQTVQVAAGTDTNAPGVPNVPVEYWVQVTTRNSLPQWFSGFISNSGLTATARATAGLRRTTLNASIYLLNRASDCFVSALNIGAVCGEDFLALGVNSLNAGGGIYMSSSNNTGLALPDVAAGSITGTVQVQAPFTYLMGSGAIQNLLGSTQWTATPMNGFPDGDYFTDPFAGLSQPPAPTGLPNHPVAGGVIAGPVVLPPGNYYSTLALLGTPTGLPIVVTGNVTFSDGQATPCGGFCNYVFYGGLVTGALSTVTFSPGRYVFAGAPAVGGVPRAGFSIGANAVVQDLTPLVSGKVTANTDAGEIFIFTDKNYSGLAIPSAFTGSGLSFPEVQAGLIAGVNASITLHGLNKDNANLPTELKPYAPVLIWQDRANTTLQYQANGFLDRSCGGVCSHILSVPGSQQMIVTAGQISGNPATNLYGTIYGPRGTWLTIVGILPGDTVAGPLQIISGALQMTINATLDVDPVPNPPSRLLASLIQ
jgi:hypothetical protein